MAQYTCEKYGHIYDFYFSPPRICLYCRQPEAPPATNRCYLCAGLVTDKTPATQDHWGVVHNDCVTQRKAYIAAQIKEAAEKRTR